MAISRALNFPRGYFVGLKCFLLGISWLRFPDCNIFICWLLSATIQKYINTSKTEYCTPNRFQLLLVLFILVLHWTFGNIGIGNSVSALTSASALALRKCYFQLTRQRFWENRTFMPDTPKYSSFAVLCYLCKFTVFKVRIMATSIHIVHSEIARVRKYLCLKSHVKRDFT